jgi:3',5'-cyclic AMP phosphodiesterase CpdA
LVFTGDLTEHGDPDEYRRLRAVVEPVAARLGEDQALQRARELVEINGAIAQRAVARDAGIPDVAGWLANRFLEPGRG